MIGAQLRNGRIVENPAAVTLPELSVGPAAASGGGMMRKPLGEYFQSLEQERGLPPGFLAKTRAIESANGTNLANPNSSARGDFQFIKSTAKAVGLTDPMDPYASAKAAADMAAKNSAAITARTGQAPDGADLYAAHQQGLGGYLKLRGGQTTGTAEMGLNGGAGQSAGGFLSMWRDKFNNAKVANLDGFVPPPSPGANQGQGQGPTMAAAAAQTPSGVPAVAAAPAPVPDNTYKGGLLGLAGVGDQSAPGMDKGFLGKMGDMAAQPGGGALGGIGKAISALAGPQQQAQPGITIAPPADGGTNKPDASLLAYLDPRRRRMMGA